MSQLANQADRFLCKPVRHISGYARPLKKGGLHIRFDTVQATHTVGSPALQLVVTEFGLARL